MIFKLCSRYGWYCSIIRTCWIGEPDADYSELVPDWIPTNSDFSNPWGFYSLSLKGPASGLRGVCQNSSDFTADSVDLSQVYQKMGAIGSALDPMQTQAHLTELYENY